MFKDAINTGECKLKLLYTTPETVVDNLDFDMTME